MPNDGKKDIGDDVLLEEYMNSLARELGRLSATDPKREKLFAEIHCVGQIAADSSTHQKGDKVIVMPTRKRD